MPIPSEIVKHTRMDFLWAYGFPFPCVTYDQCQLSNIGEVWRYPVSSNSKAPLNLPRCILPMPFALSAVVWAGAVSLVCWFAIPAAARHLRRKRGACTTCGYDLRGIATPVCPECGTPKSGFNPQ